MDQQPYQHQSPAAYDPGKRRSNRGPLLLIGILGLVLVVVLAVGAVVLFRDNDDKTQATRPASPDAVGFHRVLKAEPGRCPASPAVSAGPQITACGLDGLLYTLSKAELDGGHVTEVKAEQPPGSLKWVVNVVLDGDGARLFEKLSTELAGKTPPQNQLAIVVRGRLVSAPTVQSPIAGGKVQISGNFNQQSADQLVADITG